MLEDIFKKEHIDKNELMKHRQGFALSGGQAARRTVETYLSAIDVFISYLEQAPGFCYQVQDVENYRHYLENEKKLCSLTVRTYLSALRKFFSYLVSQKVLERNPARRVSYKSVRQNSGLVVLGSYETERLLNCIDTSTLTGLRDKAIISLLLATCCSNEELISANTEDVSLYRKKWYFHYLVSGGEPEEKIHLPKYASESVSEYMSLRGKDAVPGEPLFTSLSNRSTNSRLTARGLREILSSRIKSCGILINGAEPSPVLIRDTAACLMARSGKPPEFLMKRLNIKNRQSVMRYYNLSIVDSR